MCHRWLQRSLAVGAPVELVGVVGGRRLVVEGDDAGRSSRKSDLTG
jgi:hypothetical protein